MTDDRLHHTSTVAASSTSAGPGTPPMTDEQLAAWRDAPILLASLLLANTTSQLHAERLLDRS